MTDTAPGAQNAEISMNQRMYIYVDGESHFRRSEYCINNLGKQLEDLKALKPYLNGFPYGGDRIRIHRAGSFFWDTHVIARQLEAVDLKRAIYVTSCAGDEDAIHALRVHLRESEFEPIVIHEPRDLKDRRIHRLENARLIEKAKGVDIALATRLVEDSNRDLFDVCCLFTSDVDYLPAIEAVRRAGKNVYLFGFSENLSDRSPLRFVPDKFIDLGEVMKQQQINKM